MVHLAAFFLSPRLDFTRFYHKERDLAALCLPAGERETNRQSVDNGPKADPPLCPEYWQCGSCLMAPKGVHYDRSIGDFRLESGRTSLGTVRTVKNAWRGEELTGMTSAPARNSTQYSVQYWGNTDELQGESTELRLLPGWSLSWLARLSSKAPLQRVSTFHL